jgi:origin recognition complex subunit 4
VFPPEPGYASRFNAALDAALAAPAAEMALASLEALECTPRAAADLALAALSRMDRDAGVITARDLAQATQTLLADTYVRSLSGASVLELCLVVAASRLHRFRRMPRFNFNHLENELRAMSANDFLGDAGRARGPVLVRAFEGLLAMGLVEAAGVGARGGAVGAAERGGGGFGGFGGNGGGRARGRRFRAVRLLVTDEEVEVAVEKHPQKPAGLKDLLTHEGVRMATTGV